MSSIFGRLHADSYDLLYQEKSYDDEARLMERLFRAYASIEIKRILDLGCGTGSHAVRLASAGFDVTGVDRSPEMLAIAADKARHAGVHIELHKADIASADLGVDFDAAVMMFSVLGYQHEDTHVHSVLAGARRHLRTGGLLLMDYWHAPAVLAVGPSARRRTLAKDGDTWERTSTGTLDPDRNLCHVEIGIARMRGDRIIDAAMEHHTVRYFFPEEIAAHLDKAGFALARIGAFPDFDVNPDSTTWNVMAAAVAV